MFCDYTVTEASIFEGPLEGDWIKLLQFLKFFELFRIGMVLKDFWSCLWTSIFTSFLSFFIICSCCNFICFLWSAVFWSTFFPSFQLWEEWFFFLTFWLFSKQWNKTILSNTLEKGKDLLNHLKRKKTSTASTLGSWLNYPIKSNSRLQVSTFRV